MNRVIGKIDPTDKNVTIWGAGFSGLIMGHYLKEQGYKVTILESSNKIGGKIRTKKTSSGLVETGPNALFMSADVMDLLKEIKLEPVPASKKLRRWVLINGKFKKPMHLKLLMKFALKGRTKPPLITDGLTVADFFRPLIGQDYVDKFLSPALSGVYGAEANQLHFKSLFGEVINISQLNSYWDFVKRFSKHKKSQPRLEVSGSVSFEGGMQTLINHLGEELKREIKINHKDKYRGRGNHIVCTDASSAAEILQDEKPLLSAELKRVKYLELESSTVFLKRDIKNLNRSFGVLIPTKSEFHSIGILNNKAIFPSNYPNISSYTFIAKKQRSDDEIYSDLKNIYKEFSPEDVEFIEKCHWPRALPLYDLQRYLSVKKLHQLTKNEENLAIFGNYVSGISLREMVSAARRFTQNPIENKDEL